MNKNTLLQGFFSLVLLFLISCNKQDDVNSISIEESAKVVIDPSSQIPLKETVLSSEEIKIVSCGEAKEVTLFAGQHIDVGTLTVSNDDDYLYVRYEVTGDWLLSETHLFVGEEQDLPLNGGKNPKIGHFPYHGTHDLVPSYTFTIDLSSLSSCFVIAAHAVVVETANGEISNSETAFAYGENEFLGNRWGWYLNYCQTTCEVACSESFAKNDGSVGSSTCFLEDGFTNWGWTNSFTFYDLNVYQYTNQENYRLPLFADAEQCDTSIGTQIGYVEINIFSKDENPYATVTYVLEDTNYEFSEINLHMSAAAYPKDGQGKDTNLPEFYNFKSGAVQGVTMYTFEKLNWPVSNQGQEVFMIFNVTICASNS